MTAKAQVTTTLSSTLSTFLGNASQRILFNGVLTRHLNQIKSRSPAFEDAQVTVYDKVLLRLTDDGNNPENPAAVTFFVEEFLNINTQAPPAPQQRALGHEVTLPALLTQGAMTYE